MNDFLFTRLPTPIILPPMITGVSVGAMACGVDMASVPSGFSPLLFAGVPNWPAGFVVLLPNELAPIVELDELPLPKDEPPKDEPPKLDLPDELPPKDEPPEDCPKEEPPNDELPKLDPDPCEPAGTPNPEEAIPDPSGPRFFKLPISWPLGPT